MLKNKLWLYLAFSCLLMSCVTQRRCNIKFPPTTNTVTHETVRDSIVYMDKTVEVKIPGATVHDSVLIPCFPPVSYVPDTARAETEYARAKAWFSHSSIKLKLEQKASILQVRLDSAIKESYQWKTKYEKVTIVPEPVKYIPKIYKQAMSVCIFIFAAAFIFIGWKLFKFFKK